MALAVLTGAAVSDQNFTRDVEELSQQYQGSFNVSAEAEDRFLSVHVTFNL